MESFILILHTTFLYATEFQGKGELSVLQWAIITPQVHWDLIKYRCTKK